MEIKTENISIREIQEAEVNPNILSDSDFNRLVKSIKKDKMLTSSVLLMNDEGKYICISGHHRIKAAKKAGLKNVPALVIDKIDKSTRLRLQLQHNDIKGVSDENLIMELQKELIEEDLSLVKEIEWMGKEIKQQTIEDRPIYTYIEFCVLPDTAEEFEKLLQKFAIHDDPKYLIERAEYEDFKELLTKAFRNGYKTPGRALRMFIDKLKENEQTSN